MNPWPRRVLITGIVIVIGAPMVGLIGTVIGMIGAFHALGANGISDPKALAGDVSQVLIATMTGLIVSLVIGLPTVITGAVLLARRGQR